MTYKLLELYIVIRKHDKVPQDFNNAFIKYLFKNNSKKVVFVYSNGISPFLNIAEKILICLIL